MKKTWIGLITGLFAASALMGCAAREEGDTTQTGTTTTTNADDAPKGTPSVNTMAGGGGAGAGAVATTPGKADDMPEKKPDGEAASEAKPDDHAGHNHAPGEGH